MAESGQQSDVPRAVRSTAPAPRKKITVSLTAAQAESLRVLWQEHSTALHAMLTGWCGNAQNASDMLQELFRRLAESPSVLVRMKNTRAFLAVSARRIAVDFARRSATRTSYQTAAGAEVPVVENPGPTDENLRAAIKSALEGLPAEQRAVFEHKVLKGSTLEEIARLEAISLNTAASRLRYALDKIRGQLRPYYDDLNRSQFKNMKNDLNQDLSENKRIITPLEPKRVPSVVPGFEGLAALSTDAGVSDAPTPELAECYALPTVEAPATDFVEPQVHIDPVFVEPPTGGFDPAPEANVDGGAAEIPEEFLVTIFEGEGETNVVDNGEEVAIEGEGVPFDLESGFEICVLPVPEEFAAEFEPSELLARYEEFLGENPDWLSGLAENQGDWFHEQVVTSSACVDNLEFATPGEANAFDYWYSKQFEGSDSSATGEEMAGDGYGTDPQDASWSFDPKDLMHRYDAFLAENPDWGALDPDVMETQVITASKYFGELEFGTPSKAAAFDNWYATHHLGNAEINPLEMVSARFEPKELLPRYDAFLAENPTWIEINQGGDIQLQVITPSGYFPELEFGTPGEATAFDNWYTSWYATHHNPDGSSSGADDNGTLLVIGGPVDVPTEIHLPKEGVDGAGTLNGSGLVLDGRTGDFAGGTVVTGGRVVDGEIQPHWRSGGDASGPVYSLSGGGSGLVLGGGTLAAGGLSSGTVVTGGEVVTATGQPADNSIAETGAGILSNPGLSLYGRTGDFADGAVFTGGEVAGSGVLNAAGLSLDGRTGNFPGQTVIEGGEVQIDPSLIWQFDPSRWEGTGLESRVAELMRAYDPAAQSASEEVEAPVTGLREAGNAEDSGTVGAIEPVVSSTEPAGAVAQASVGKAPVAPSEVLGVPIEIAAAEISSAGSATGSGDFVSAVSTAQGVHSPNAEPGTASLGAVVGAHADLAPHALAAAAGDFVAHEGADVSRDAVADAPVAQKHDSTTVAAGAVAVGGVAHGSGAAAAAARKPLPQI